MGILTAIYESPLGTMLLAAEGGKLIGAWFVGQKYFPQGLPEPAEKPEPVLLLARKWLDRYYSGQAPDPAELPLEPRGTDFQREVWQQLLAIPWGHTVTYGEIAASLAARRGLARMSAQAVGGAVGHNPISVIIPCHRVLGSGGSLTGYAGGLDKKQWLLQHEGSLSDG